MSNAIPLSPNQRNAVSLMSYALSLSKQTSLEQVLPNSHNIDTTISAFEKLIDQHLGGHERAPQQPYLTPEQEATLGILTMAVSQWQQTGLLEMAINGDSETQTATDATIDSLTTAAQQHGLPAC